MINRHIAYYLSSKLIAAIINVGTLAVFLRIGGTDTYGAYVVVLAWAYLIYGFTLQWLRFSFFACYQKDTERALVTTYLGTLLAAVSGIASISWLLATAGVVSSSAGAAVTLLVIGLAMYDALHEIARTRLRAGAVALGVLVRAVLMLVLGAASLSIYGTPMALVVSVTLAHLGAAVPLACTIIGMGRRTWSKTDARQLWRYGRPLIPAYGLDMVGGQLDRLLLARSSPLSDVGSYGAVADFIRQSMIVVSEAISGAYIAIAKSHTVAGRFEDAADVLGRAFLAYTALAAFGSAFILRFADLAIKILFGGPLSPGLEPVIPVIVASAVFLVFRAYYFGQVLHLLNDSRLLLISNAFQAVLVALTGLLLVPLYGMWGAAVASLAGQMGGCIVYAWVWRKSYVMRLPYTDALTIVGVALAAYVVSGILQHHLGNNLNVAGINAGVLLATATITAYRYNVMSFNDLVQRARRIVPMYKRLGE